MVETIALLHFIEGMLVLIIGVAIGMAFVRILRNDGDNDESN